MLTISFLIALVVAVDTHPTVIAVDRRPTAVAPISTTDAPISTTVATLSDTVVSPPSLNSTAILENEDIENEIDPYNGLQKTGNLSCWISHGAPENPLVEPVKSLPIHRYCLYTRVPKTKTIMCSPYDYDAEEDAYIDFIFAQNKNIFFFTYTEELKLLQPPQLVKVFICKTNLCNIVGSVHDYVAHQMKVAQQKRNNTTTVV